jgi:hypothetical protein
MFLTEKINKQVRIKISYKLNGNEELQFIFRILGSHSGEREESHLLGHLTLNRIDSMKFQKRQIL